MKVIVCGAGQVGFNIARHLAHEQNDVTVIDRSEELINKVRNSLDVHAMVGYASYPDLLESAGAEDADMIIAVTLFDEVNIVACQVAHSLFNVPTKIAESERKIILTLNGGRCSAVITCQLMLLSPLKLKLPKRQLTDLRCPGQQI